MKKLLFAAIVGGVLAWFLDPDSGARRRQGVQNWLAELGVTGPGSKQREDREPVTPPLATVR